MFKLFGRRASKDTGDLAAADAAQQQQLISYFWIPDKEEVYELGQLAASQGGKDKDVLTLQYVSKGRGSGAPSTITIKKSDCIEAYNYSEETSKPEDLIKLSDVNPAAILNSTKLRFREKNIFTSMGSILMLVNPFQKIAKNYGQSVFERYRNPYVDDLPTHLYLIPSRAYMAMVTLNQNQAILISGESGAGKTEATKESLAFLTYIAAVSHDSRAASDKGGSKTSSERCPEGSASAIASKIIAASPILEAFGNAKTVRNPNSSRFGKWMVLHFNSKNQIIGSTITSYLLEKSRITQRSKLERNYHIFYQLLRGASDDKLEFLRIANNTRQYKLLCGEGGQEAVDLGDKAVFKETFAAFMSMGFSDDDFWTIMKVVASVLHLGDITFDLGSDGESASLSADSKPFIDVCLLLEAAKDSLSAALTSSVVSTGGNRSSITMKRFTVAKAMETRDSLMRALYSRLFLNIIDRINEQNMISNGDSAAKYIGLLDIFGFEIFEQNSFEQLCINYCNEMLQNHFNYVIFTMEKQLYEDEGITCSTIECTDNMPVIADIEKSFVSLDEESRVPKPSSKAWLDKMKKGAIDSAKKTGDPNPPFKNFEFSKQDVDTFTVHHYAGNVLYSSSSFLEKNSETISNDLINAVNLSRCKLVKGLFADSVNDTPQRIVSKSVSKGFKDQLNSLMQMLRTTQSHFIRCIKSNDGCKPMIFDSNLVSKQLLYSGVFEVVKIQQSGLPMRITKETFLRLYTCLVPIDMRKGVAGSCDNLLTVIKNQNIDMPMAQVGRRMVFFKSFEYNQLEAKRRVVEYESSLLMQQWLREAFFKKTLHRYLRYLLLCKEVQALLDRNRVAEAGERIKEIRESVGRHTVSFHIDIFSFIVTEVETRLRAGEEQVLFIADLEKVKADYSIAKMQSIKDLIHRASRVGLQNNETILGFSELLHSYEKGMLLCSIKDDDYSTLVGLTVSDLDRGLRVLTDFPNMFADAPAVIDRSKAIREAYIKEIDGYVGGLRECLERETFVTDDQGRLGVSRMKAADGRYKEHTLSSFVKTIAFAELKSQECRDCFLDCERYLKITEVLLPQRDLAGIVSLLEEGAFKDVKMVDRMRKLRAWTDTQISFGRLAESFRSVSGSIPGTDVGNETPVRVDTIETCVKQFNSLDPKYPAAMLLLRSATSLINLRKAFLSEKWGGFQMIFNDIVDNDKNLMGMPEFASEQENCRWQVQYRGFIDTLSGLLQANFFGSTIMLENSRWADSLRGVTTDGTTYAAASAFASSNGPALLGLLPIVECSLELRSMILSKRLSASQNAFEKLNGMLGTSKQLDDLTETLLRRDLAVCSSLLSYLHLETALIQCVSRLDQTFLMAPDKELASSMQGLLLKSDKLLLTKCPPDFANDIIWYKKIVSGLEAVVSTPAGKGSRFLWQEALSGLRLGSSSKPPSEHIIADAHEELSLECTRRLVTCGFLELVKNRHVFGSTGCLTAPDQAASSSSSTGLTTGSRKLDAMRADFTVLSEITSGLLGIDRELISPLANIAGVALAMRSDVVAGDWTKLESSLNSMAHSLLSVESNDDAAIANVYGEEFVVEYALCRREVAFHRAVSRSKECLQEYNFCFIDQITIDTNAIDETPIVDASEDLLSFESRNAIAIQLVAVSAALIGATRYARGNVGIPDDEDKDAFFALEVGFEEAGVANGAVRQFIQFVEYKYAYDYLYSELVANFDDFLENRKNLSKIVYKYKYTNTFVTEHTKGWIRILFLMGNIISMLRSQEWRAVLSSLDLLDQQLRAATCPNGDSKFKDFLSDKSKQFRESATRSTHTSMMSIISTTGQVRASTYETKFSVAAESLLIIEGALEKLSNSSEEAGDSTSTAARLSLKDNLTALLEIRRAAARESGVANNDSVDSFGPDTSAEHNIHALSVEISQKFSPSARPLATAEKNVSEITKRIENERRLLVQKQTFAKMVDEIEDTFCENKLLLWDNVLHCISVDSVQHRALISQLEAIAAFLPHAVHDVLSLRVVERAVSVASIVVSAQAAKSPDIGSCCQSLQDHVKVLYNLKTLLEPDTQEGILATVTRIIVVIEDEVYLSDSFAALLTRGRALIEMKIFDIIRFADLCEEVAYAVKSKDLHSKISSKNDAIIQSVTLAREICGQMLDIGHALSAGAQARAQHSEALLRSQATRVSADFVQACGEWIDGLLYPQHSRTLTVTSRSKLQDVPYEFPPSTEYDLVKAVARVSCGSDKSLDKVYKYSLEDLVIEWVREQCSLLAGGMDMEAPVDMEDEGTMASAAFYGFPYSLDDEALGKLTQRLAAVYAGGRVVRDDKVQAVQEVLTGLVSYSSHAARHGSRTSSASSPGGKNAAKAAAQEPLPPSIIAVDYCSYIIRPLKALSRLELPQKSSHFKTDILKIVTSLERFRERVYHSLVGIDMAIFDPWSPAWLSRSAEHLKDCVFKRRDAPISDIRTLSNYINQSHSHDAAVDDNTERRSQIDDIVKRLDSSPQYMHRLAGMYVHRMDFISQAQYSTHDARAAVAKELAKHHADVEAPLRTALKVLFEKAFAHPELLLDDSTALLAEIWQLRTLSSLDLNDLVVASTAEGVYSKILPTSNGFAPVSDFIGEFTPILSHRVAVKRFEVYLHWAIHNLNHVDRVDAEESFEIVNGCSPLHLSIAKWCVSNRCLHSTDIAAFFPEFVNVRSDGKGQQQVVEWVQGGVTTTLPPAASAMLLQQMGLLHYKQQALRLHSSIMAYLIDLAATTGDAMSLAQTDVSKFVDDNASRVAWTHNSALLADTYTFSAAFNQLFSPPPNSPPELLEGGAVAAGGLYGLSTSTQVISELLADLKSLLIVKSLFATISCDDFNRFPYIFSVVTSRLFSDGTAAATSRKKKNCSAQLKALLQNIESMYSGYQDLIDAFSSKRFEEGIALRSRILKSVAAVRAARLPSWADNDHVAAFLADMERRVLRQTQLCEEMALARDVNGVIDSMSGFSKFVQRATAYEEGSEGEAAVGVTAADFKESLYMCLADPNSNKSSTFYTSLIDRVETALAADTAFPLWTEETMRLCQRALIIFRLRPVRSRSITVNSDGIVIPYSPESEEHMREMFSLADRWYSGSIPDPYCGAGSSEIKVTLSLCINFRTRNLLKKINTAAVGDAPFELYESALSSALSPISYVKLDEYVADLVSTARAFETKIANRICSVWALKMLYNTFTVPEYEEFDIYVDSSSSSRLKNIDYRLAEDMISAAIGGVVSRDVESLVVTPSSFRIQSYPADPSHSNSLLLIDNLSHESIQCINRILAKDMDLLSKIPSFDKISKEVYSSVFSTVFSDVSATTLLASTHIAASQTLLRRSIALRVHGRQYDFTQHLSTAAEFLDFITRRNSYVMDYLESSGGIVADERGGSGVTGSALTQSQPAGTLPSVVRRNISVMRRHVLDMTPLSRSNLVCADMLKAVLQDFLDSNESIMDVDWGRFLQSHIPSGLRVLITAASQTLNLQRIRRQMQADMGSLLLAQDFIDKTRSDLIALFFQSYKQLHLLFVAYKAAYNVLKDVNDVHFQEIERQNEDFTQSVEWTLGVRFNVASQEWPRIERLLADQTIAQIHVCREGYSNLLTFASGMMAHNRALDALRRLLTKTFTAGSTNTAAPLATKGVAVADSISNHLFQWIDNETLASLVSSSAMLSLQTKELNDTLKIAYFVVALQAQILKSNWYADTLSHEDEEQEVNRVLGGVRPVDAVRYFRPRDFSRWLTTSVSNLLHHEQPAGPYATCPREIVEEINRCFKECDTRRVEYYLSRAVRKGRDYIYKHIDFALTVETKELQVLLSEVSGLEISARNSALFAAGWVILHLRESVKRGDWVGVRYWLSESHGSLDLHLAHEARLEIEEMRRIARDNERMHARAAEALQTGCIRGSHFRLDTSSIGVAEVIAVLKLAFSLPVISPDDEMLLYSAEKLKNIRISIIMRNYRNLHREVMTVDTQQLMDCASGEVLLVRHALDFCKVLENISYHISSDRLCGRPGSVNANSAHSSRLKSFLDAVDESKCSGELCYYISSARRVQQLRMAVKGNRWCVEEASSRVLRYFRTFLDDAGYTPATNATYVVPTATGGGGEHLLLSDIDAMGPRPVHHRAIKVRHIDFISEVFGREHSDYDAASATYGTYMLIDSSSYDTQRRTLDHHSDREDVRGSAEKAAMLMTMEALDKAQCEYVDRKTAEVFLSMALFPDEQASVSVSEGENVFPTNTVPHLICQSGGSVLGLAEDELLLVRDELYDRITCRLLLEALDPLNAGKRNKTEPSTKPEAAPEAAASIAEAIHAAHHLGVKSWPARRLLNTAMLIQDIRSLMSSMGGIGLHTTSADFRRAMSLLSKVGLLKSKDLFDPVGAAEVDAVFAAVCRQQILNEINAPISSRDAPADYSLLNKAIRRAEQVNAYKDRDTNRLIHMGRVLLCARRARSSGVADSMQKCLAITQKAIRGSSSVGLGGEAECEQIDNMLYHIQKEMEGLSEEISLLTSLMLISTEQKLPSPDVSSGPMTAATRANDAAAEAAEPPLDTPSGDCPPGTSTNDYLIHAIRTVTNGRAPEDEIPLHSTSKFFQHIKRLALERFSQAECIDADSVTMRNRIIVKLTAILVLAAASRPHVQATGQGARSPSKGDNNSAPTDGSALTARVLLLLIPILEITMAETLQSTSSHLSHIFTSGAAATATSATNTPLAMVNRQPTNTVALVRYSEFLSRVLLDHIEHVSVRACYAVDKLQSFGALQCPALRYTRGLLQKYV